MQTLNPKVYGKTVFAGALLASALVSGQPAFSATTATATSNLTVNATVKGFCTISDATLGFGDVSATGSQGSPSVTNYDGSTSITATCNKGTTGTITASMGANPDGTTIRRMASGSDLLSYRLYTDSGRSTELLPTTTGFTISGNGSSQSKTIYGRIPGGTNVDNAPNGTYSDTVVLTISYGL